jgi:hypothetical protein
MTLVRHIKRPLAPLALVLGLLAISTAGPAPLAASTPPTSTHFSRAAFCDYLGRAIALLEAQRQTPLRDFLLAQLRKLDTTYCS